MRAMQVVAGQGVKQFVVTGHDIGEQQVFMDIDEFRLDGLVKALDMGIYFWVRG